MKLFSISFYSIKYIDCNLNYCFTDSDKEIIRNILLGKLFYLCIGNTEIN